MRLTPRQCLGLMRGGDWLSVALALALVGWAARYFWLGGAADKVEIRAAGQHFATLPLGQARRVEVPGPLGRTVVEIEATRVRVASDPGPRQYCVQQGWLTRAGEVAVCLPNQVSVSLEGRQRMYDSLAY